jgi:hypothetical protein
MIAVILILSCLLNLYGIDWGLPSQERISLVFPVYKENGALFKLLKEKNKKSPIETPFSPNQYGMSGSKGLEFSPDRFPPSEPMQALLRSYLLATSQEREYSVVAAVSRMDARQVNFNPHFFQYGGCFIYTVGLALKVTSLFGWVNLTPDLSSYFNHPQAIRKVYIVGRMVVVFSVMVSCLLLYLLGKSLYGRETGLFAALAFGISPGVVASSHIMKPHIFGVCFVLLFLICVLRVKESGLRSWYILSGLSLGLAIGSSPYLIIFFLYLVTCHLLRSAKGGIKEYIVSLKDRNLLLALSSMLFAFFLTNPYYLLSFKEILTEVMYSVKPFSFSLSSEHVSRFTFSFFWIIHGLSLSLLIGGGLFYSLTRGREYWFLPLLPLLYFLIASAVVGKSGQPQLSFALSLTPFTSLLAGIAVQNLRSFQKRWINIILIVVFGITFFHSLFYSYNFRQDATHDSTFYRAGAWINQSIPQGSSIGVMSLVTPATTPPFDFRSFKITVYTPRELSAGKRYLSQYFVADRRIDDFLVPHYQLIQSFYPSIPISTVRFTDHFARANRPVFIYKRIQESGFRINVGNSLHHFKYRQDNPVKKMLPLNFLWLNANLPLQR